MLHQVYLLYYNSKRFFQGVPCVYLVLVTFVYAVLVVKHCGQLCGQRRDRRLVAERELAQFIRGIMEFIYPMTRIPADYEVAILLKPFECECADIDVNLYRLHLVNSSALTLAPNCPSFISLYKNCWWRCVETYRRCGNVCGRTI